MDLDYNDSSSSSDEEIFDLVANLERPRLFHPRIDAFNKFNDEEFKQRYRLAKATVHTIVSLLEDDLAPETLRNHALSVADQVLIALRFYATGSFQILVGDDFGVHKSTVSRVVKKVSEHIAALRPQFVKLPETNEEVAEVKTTFHSICGFPNVIGCVDGTHIPILSPGGDNAELFRNRKGYFSVNVQAVSAANLLIENIDARWPGSTHDSTMWNASMLAARCERNEFGNSYFLGDSAYACKKYLMTPLLNVSTVPEQNYNTAHIQTRNCVERCFGVWKRRFACLSLGLRTRLETALTVIIATAVLHNIAIIQNDLDDFDDVQLNEDVNHDIIYEVNGGGNAFRRALIETVFR